MYKGTYTALVTPFTNDGAFDEAAFKKLVEGQIKAGVAGLVPCGTTGETPTLSEAERERVVGACVALCKGKVPVIAGTGSNSTQETIARTQRAKALGADAALVVVPYYNKPTQEGLYRHFMAVAEHGGLPIVLYNVPGRTACDMQADTVARLQAVSPAFVALKEACGSVDRVAELRARCRADFSLLSGDDALTWPMMAVGADGVVSVASNVLPEKVVALTAAALAGDVAKARALHLSLRLLFRDLFCEASPSPAKAALEMLGQMSAAVRLPLVPATERARVLMREALLAAGVSV